MLSSKIWFYILLLHDNWTFNFRIPKILIYEDTNNKNDVRYDIFILKIYINMILRHLSLMW